MDNNNSFLADWLVIMKLVFDQQLKIILPTIYMICGGLVVIITLVFLTMLVN